MLYLYNTLTKQKEAFKPLNEKTVGMYNCGPTVYDYVHIGNLRTFLLADLLRRTLMFNGLVVKQIMNITDIGHLSEDTDGGEDKMTKALRRENKPITLEAIKEIAEFYTKEFEKDIEAMNILHPDTLPRASEHIPEQIEIIKRLYEKDIAYKIDDGIYFNTSKFKKYGELGNINVDTLKEGARVETNAQKRNPADFSLWKFNDNLGWESPWGKGFPGWHIECSAMSMKYLGETFDIHTGGTDNVPVHHNNEIAQSESYTGKKFVNYWIHGAHVTVGGGKMAKSEGTGITLKTILDKGYSPIDYRYWLLTAHYRSLISFSWKALEASANALNKLNAFILKTEDHGEINQKYIDKFTETINDDLDTPKSIALVWKIVKDDALDDKDKKATILEIDKVLGLGLQELSPTVVPDEVKALAEEREEARKKEDWAGADKIRAKIEKLGFKIDDTDNRYTLTEVA